MRILANTHNGCNLNGNGDDRYYTPRIRRDFMYSKNVVGYKFSCLTFEATAWANRCTEGDDE